MVAKVRLLGWIGVLTCASVVLLRTATWPGAGDPAAATMAVVQLVAGVLAAYLVVATVLAIRLPRLAPAFVHRLVVAAVGSTLVLAPMTAAGAAPQRAATPSDAPVLHKLADHASTTTTTTAPAEPSGSGRERPREATPFPPSSASEVTVASGDHLWGIAERTLAARLGRLPTDAETAPYWSQLIEANRDRLATGDPDLIFAGQVFRLPS